MVVANYGVWRATPTRYTYQDRHDDAVSPHLSLYFADGESGEGTAAINIKSGDQQDSRLAYWTIPRFTHPITERLAALANGFHLLGGTPEQEPGGLALDFIRGNLFRRNDGHILPHDVPGPDNDILDELKPILDRAISGNATVYIYGSSFGDGKGIHDVHMNQGSPRRWARDNGVFQDGALIIQFADHWEAIFIAFASQAIHTEDGPTNAGQPLPPTGSLTWAEFLAPELPKADRAQHDLDDSPVLIAFAIFNQLGAALDTVLLSNRTDKEIEVSEWRIVNTDGQSQELSGLRLAAKDGQVVKLANALLSSQGGILTLLNAKGLKVHGVSYTKLQAQEGIVVFPDSMRRLPRLQEPSQPQRPIPRGFIRKLDNGHFLVKTRNVSPAKSTTDNLG